MIMRFASLLAPCFLLAASGTISAGLEDPALALNRKWAGEMFPATSAQRLVILHEDEPGDTKLRRCVAGGPLRLGEKTYSHGIGVNSQSTLRVMLDRPARTLLAIIGLDRNVDNTKASCRFRVRVGTNEPWATDILRASSAPRPLSVPLGGAKEFDLIVDDAGDGRGWDQGNWADARGCWRTVPSFGWMICRWMVLFHFRSSMAGNTPRSSIASGPAGSRSRRSVTPQAGAP
jgi:hypothetical protein